MNTTHEKYNIYLSISNNWPLDDWSITKECFDKIVEILPFGKTILEIGSGNSTNILSNFYNIISVESNPEWLYKFNSQYIYIPEKYVACEIFGETRWLDNNMLNLALKNKNYDLMIIDAGFDRVGIYKYLDIFRNVPIIFDDTMNENYLKCANLTANKLNKSCYTYQCKPQNPPGYWTNGKKYSIIL